MGPAYLAGFSPGRRSTGVHDPLYARCLYLDDGHLPLALVTLDLVGFLHHDVADLRSRLTRDFASSVIVSSTHVHAAPDTLGLWGPGFIVPVGSGIDPDYIERIKTASAACVGEAATSARPASAAFARGQAPSDASFNIHAEDRPDLASSKDDALTVMHWTDLAGAGVATVVSWACHPEALGRDNTLVTADYPAPLERRIEQTLGGTALYVNGAIGGLVTVRIPETGPHDFELAEAVGTRIADAALAALAAPDRVTWSPAPDEVHGEVHGEVHDELHAVSRAVPIAFDNGWWRFFHWVGLLDVILDDDDNVASDVTAWRVGPSVWLTVPGEIFPSLGRRYKTAMASDFPFLVGLGNDELGYIMEPAEFEDDTYDYEQMMSPGPATGPTLTTAVDAVLQALAERNVSKSRGGAR